MVPVITVSNSVPTMYLPLATIVLISLLKDGYEDYKRYRADEEENRKNCWYLNPIK